MTSRSYVQGWGDAALDATIVGGVAVLLDYAGISKVLGTLIADLVSEGTGGSAGRFLAPLVTGATIWLTVFIYDLVMMYKYDYHKS